MAAATNPEAAPQVFFLASMQRIQVRLFRDQQKKSLALLWGARANSFPISVAYFGVNVTASERLPLPIVPVEVPMIVRFLAIGAGLPQPTEAVRSTTAVAGPSERKIEEQL